MQTTQTTQTNETKDYEIVKKYPQALCTYHYNNYRVYRSELDLLNSVNDCSRCRSWQSTRLSHSDWSAIKYRHSQLKAF